MPLTYRIGTPGDIPAIAELLAMSDMYWPGAAATPYVAVDESGEVAAVFFKTLCFHAEPFVARPGSAASVTALADLMRQSFEDFAAEMGHPITVYSMVQDNDRARAAASKNGMVPSRGVLYEATVQSRQALVGSDVIEAELV